jgi:hypothetical protein
MRSFISSTLLFASGAVAQYQDLYTATGTAEVAAAAATALTTSPTSHVKGKAFDRFVVVWLENTDYDMAANDRKSLSHVQPIHHKLTLVYSQSRLAGEKGNHTYRLSRRHTPLAAQLRRFHWR